MIINIVLLAFLVALLVAQGLLLRKISKFRRLNRTGFDLCIQAVEAHTRGEDWRPIMEEVKVIRGQMDAL